MKSMELQLEVTVTIDHQGIFVRQYINVYEQWWKCLYTTYDRQAWQLREGFCAFTVSDALSCFNINCNECICCTIVT